MSWQTLLFGCLGIALFIGALAVRRRAYQVEGAKARGVVVGVGLAMVLAGGVFLVLFARAIPVGF